MSIKAWGMKLFDLYMGYVRRRYLINELEEYLIQKRKDRAVRVEIREVEASDE